MTRNLHQNPCWSAAGQRPARRPTITLPSLLLLALFLTSPVYAESYLPRTHAKEGDTFRAAFVPAVKTITPAVVEVRVAGERAALGCVVSPDGWVVTKASEVFRGAASVRPAEDQTQITQPPGGVLCVRQDGTRWPTLVVGVDRETDLALLKAAAPLEPWPYVHWGVTWHAAAASDEPAPDDTSLELARVRPVVSMSPGPWAVVPGFGTALQRRTGGVLAVGVVSAAPRPIKSRARMGVFFASGSVRPLVRFVQPESGAALAGLRTGDVLVSVDGTPTPTPLEVVEALSDKLAGDAVAVTIRRGGAAQTDQPETQLELKIVLGVGPDRPDNRSGRMNEASGPLSRRRSGFPDAFQHDARIAPSSCGGPVVSLDGNVLGLNIARPERVGVLALTNQQVHEALVRMTAETNTTSGP